MIWKTVFLVVLAVGTLADSPFRATCGKDTDKKNRDASQCFKNSVGSEDLKKEILDATKDNNFVTVIKKYCEKSAEVKGCIHSYYDAFAPCQAPFIQANIVGVYNASDEAIDYVCYNDAERVSSFVADGGLQCFQEKSNGIDECARNITSATDSFTIDPQQEHCRIFDEIQTCVLSYLEKCPTSAALNVAQSLFAILRKAHTCTK